MSAFILALLNFFESACYVVGAVAIVAMVGLAWWNASKPERREDCTRVGR